MNATTDQASLVSRLTGVKLPAGSEVRYIENPAGGDPLLRAKIAMSASAFKRLLADNQWSLDQFSPANRDFLGVDDGEWTPQARPPFPVMSIEPVNGEFLYVGYEAAGDTVMVYLLWFRA